MSEPLLYLNGQFLPQSQAHLPLHDAGFIWGATVTDLCRTFQHQPFRLAEHLRRFRQSCEAAAIPQPRSDAELSDVAEQLLRHNTRGLRPEQELALVVFATPGPVGYYLGEPGGPGDGTPTLGMHTFPLPFRRYVRLFQQGARLVIPSIRAVPPACVDPRIKQRSRLHWWLAEREVQDVEPGASALLCDEPGHVTETAAANFLLVREGVVLSPPSATILGGISLQVVRELCQSLNIPFTERPLSLTDCRQAEEAMLVSTSYCLAGVSSLANVERGARSTLRVPRWPGPIYQRLLDAWGRLVGVDVAGQILADV